MFTIHDRDPDLSKCPSETDVEEGCRAETLKESKQVSTFAQFFWLSLWMVNNIGVTLLNKAVFKNVNFNYPYALSAVHMFCNAIGATLFALFSPSVPVKRLEWKHKKVVLAFSFLFAANIAVGNDSLRHVSVSFNQVMRSLVPGVVMAMGLCMGKQFSTQKKLAVIPVVVGIALACLGEIRFTALGFFITCLCVLLAALKVVVSGMALTGDMKLHPIDLLIKMAPLAFFECFLMSWYKGEMEDIVFQYEDLLETKAIHLVFLTGLMSFSLNVLSFTANKVTSPLTLTVSANVKQAILIIMGTVVFGTPISFTSSLGILIVILGSGRYSYVGYIEQQEKMGLKQSK